MKCDFLGYGGGWFGSYKCEKTGDSLDKSTVNMYCVNSLRYKDCPIFRSYWLTSVTGEILNIHEEEDKCLESVKWYMDSIVPNLEHGSDFLKSYNKVGPQIAEYIRDDENAYMIANICREGYIEPTVSLINEGKKLQESGKKTSAEKAFYEAMESYAKMTQRLMQYFRIDPNELEAPVYDKGIARAIKPINNKKSGE